MAPLLFLLVMILLPPHGKSSWSIKNMVLLNDTNWQALFLNNYTVQFDINAFNRNVTLLMEQIESPITVGPLDPYKMYVNGSAVDSKGHSGYAFGRYSTSDKRFKGEFHMDDDSYCVQIYKYKWILYRTSDQYYPVTEPQLIDSGGIRVITKAQREATWNVIQEPPRTCQLEIVVDSSMYKELKNAKENIPDWVKAMVESTNEVFKNPNEISLPNGIQLSLANLFIANETICRTYFQGARYICTKNYTTHQHQAFLQDHDRMFHKEYCLSIILTKKNFGLVHGSVYTGGACLNRRRVKNEVSGKKQYVSANTAFMYVPEDEETRNRGLAQLIQQSFIWKEHCSVSNIVGQAVIPTQCQYNGFHDGYFAKELRNSAWHDGCHTFYDPRASKVYKNSTFFTLSLFIGVTLLIAIAFGITFIIRTILLHIKKHPIQTEINQSLM